MKISIALTVLILALGGSVVWRNHQVLVTREVRAADLADSGSSPDGRHPTSFRPRERMKPEVRARFVLERFSACLREDERLELESPRWNFSEGRRDSSDSILEILEQVSCLNADELDLLMAELPKSGEFITPLCPSIIRTILTEITTDHPSIALEYLFRTSDPKSFQEASIVELIQNAIESQAKHDPSAALTWLRKCEGKFTEYDLEAAKKSMMAGVTAGHPESAFHWLGEVGLVDPRFQGIPTISESCTTSAQLIALNAGLQSHLRTIANERERNTYAFDAEGFLTYSAVENGFETATRWFAATNLPANEIGDAGLMYTVLDPDSAHSSEISKWGRWIIDHFSTCPMEKCLRDFVTGWAKNDYRATAEWIRNAPEGAAKISAVSAYAEIISEYEPASAVQWADSLPAGSDRDQTLKKIRENWAKKDAEEAAAFSLKYGIK